MIYFYGNFIIPIKIFEEIDRFRKLNNTISRIYGNTSFPFKIISIYTNSKRVFYYTWASWFIRYNMATTQRRAKGRNVYELPSIIFRIKSLRYEHTMSLLDKFDCLFTLKIDGDRLVGVLVRVIASSAGDRGFDQRMCHDIKICTKCFCWTDFDTQHLE